MNKILLDIAGTNINGEDVIVGWMSEEEAAEHYAETLDWSGAMNHPSAHGRNFHIGDGIWMSRCTDPECDAYVVSYGSLPAHANRIGIGHHEVDAHGLKVAGINVGLLA